MGRDGALNIGGMAFNTAATFGVAVILARSEGLAAVGEYSAIFAVRAILVLLCGMGMRIALTKYVAAARALGNYGRLRSVLVSGIGIPLILSVAVAVVLALFRSTIDRHLFTGQGHGELWIILLAVSLPFGVALDLILAASRGFQNAASAVLIGQVIEPGGRLALTAAAVLAGLGTTGAVWALTLAAVIAATTAGLSLRRQISGLHVGVAQPVSQRELFSFAGISWLASLATQGLLWADIVILSVMTTSEQVGIYQVATRLVLMAMVCITPLTQSLAPRVAHYWEIQDLDALRDRYQAIILWSWRLTIAAFACLLIVPASALQLFGGSLPGGVAVVYILSFGALVESFAAPSAVLLNQIGRNALNMLINSVNLAMNISLNILLIPVMGISGSALAWSISLAFPGLLRVWLVRRLVFHHTPFTRLHLRALAWAAIAAGVGAIALMFTPDLWWLRLVTVVPVVLFIYTVGTLRFGLGPDEAVVVSQYGRLLSRDLSTRLPEARRWADQRRSRKLPAGSHDLLISELVSPYRFDVWARRALYDYAVAHEKTRQVDFVSFVAGAKATAYGHWFDTILLTHLGLDGSSPRVRARTFEQSVIRALRLLDGVTRDGFDSRYPVTVTRLPAFTPLEGRSLAEDRWITVDGNHRLALLLQSGRTVLHAHEYRVRADAAPRNNTPALTEGLDEVELSRFYAQGLVAPSRRPTVGSWRDLLDSLSTEANRPCLEKWPEHTRFDAPPHSKQAGQ